MRGRDAGRRVGLSSAVAVAIVLAATGCDRPQQAGKSAPAPAPASVPAKAAPVIPIYPQKEAYFGEQHLHTAYSLDAYIGGARLMPADAYRFAKGEEVDVGGVKVRLARAARLGGRHRPRRVPRRDVLDDERGRPGHDNAQLKELRSLKTIEEREKWFLEYVVKNNRGETPQHPPFYAGPETTVERLEADPGRRRTALPARQVHDAFPLSSGVPRPKGGNLHRNVFFRDMNVPERPMSYVDINREEALWAWMAEPREAGHARHRHPAQLECQQGHDVRRRRLEGRAARPRYAEMRSRFEPLIEMMQIKGNSEVHRWFWAADEFANFENADSLGDYSGRDLKKFGKQNWVRWGVTKGLAYEKSLGVNPYHYGFVGGTDNHNGTPSNVDEDNFHVGSHGAADGTVERRRTSEVGGWLKGKDLNPGSLTGVWAPQNTREAIWDALKARETFATSGPRIKVRLLRPARSGRRPPTRRASSSRLRAGRADGRHAQGPGEGAPSFTVWAMKEPDDANLDRIQIIKGWVDAKGEPQDQVFDVVWSGNRKPDASGKLPAVGNTVDLEARPTRTPSAAPS